MGFYLSWRNINAFKWILQLNNLSHSFQYYSLLLLSAILNFSHYDYVIVLHQTML
ncbi:hypothetical protein PALI_a0215 [Pseudoalteromonas aliena SW19]|uniref:Uncharacterized protein n=1 Tax=Pseudoalteromonas aliena SW19 TaxID=1314866 RepID=A0ABR9DXP0_9GAMM|nr:hypothetical protein [Pseudoalteromonas aliena SW19]